MDIWVNFVHLIFIFFLPCHSESNPPITGHGQELGKHRPPEGEIETFDILPSSKEFWENFASKRKPALFRGVAKKFPAFNIWTDSYMNENFGEFKVKLEAKAEKEAYPEGEFGVGQDKLRHFLETYQQRNAYIVSQLPDPMASDVLVLPFLNCGTFKERILEANLWLSSGGTKSLLHRDADNAINCLLNGTKDWVLIDPNHEDLIPIAKEDLRAYGGFSLLNPDSVNLELYPRVRELPWWHANMTAGDCLFLPYGYWHQVRSYGAKNLAVSVLFSRLKEVDLEECDRMNPDFVALSDSEMIFHYDGFSDQTMGNTDPFELKEKFVELCQKHGMITEENLHESILQDYNEFEETDVQPVDLDVEFNREVAKQLMSVLDETGSGKVSCEDVKLLKLDTLTILADMMSNDPANTENYEYANFKPGAISELIVDVLHEATVTNDGVVTLEMFVREYQSLGGSLKIAKEIFALLDPEGTERITHSDIFEHISTVLGRFELKTRVHQTEAQEWGRAQQEHKSFQGNSDGELRNDGQNTDISDQVEGNEDHVHPITWQEPDVIPDDSQSKQSYHDGKVIIHDDL